MVARRFHIIASALLLSLSLNPTLGKHRKHSEDSSSGSSSSGSGSSSSGSGSSSSGSGSSSSGSGSSSSGSGSSSSGSGSSSGEDDRPFGMVVAESTKTFDETWSSLIEALDGNPNVNIIAVVDHADAAEKAGLPTLLPNRVVAFGNPNLGTPLMVEKRSVGIDLPQKMQVWQDEEGVVFLGYNSVGYLERRHRKVARSATVDTIAGALKKFASVASGVPEGSIEDNGPFRKGRKGSRMVKKSLKTVKSDADFDTTWDRLVAAIDDSPASVAYIVDHDDNSKGVLPNTHLIVFGNPNLGTPLMQMSPTTGIDLPLKILVWEGGGGEVYVTTNTIKFLERRHFLHMHGIKDQLETIQNAIANFVDKATVTA